jgi:hypothetical protein
MKLESGTESSRRAAAAYTSPNDPFGGSLEPLVGAAVDRAIDVSAPQDLVKRADAPASAPVAPVIGVDPAEHEQVRRRVSFLEGALESSAKVEAAAREFADRVEERARASRERYDKDVSELRVQLDTKERELRTLALEMGKLQGRLEVTQQKLLAPREPSPSPTNPGAAGQSSPLDAASPAGTRSFLESERGLFLSGVAVAVAIVVVVSLLR